MAALGIGGVPGVDLKPFWNASDQSIGRDSAAACEAVMKSGSWQEVTNLMLKRDAGGVMVLRALTWDAADPTTSRALMQGTRWNPYWAAA